MNEGNSHKRLLIVDDDTVLRDELYWALRRDFDLEKFGDCDAALEVASHRSFDLVLLDLHLPPAFNLEHGLQNIESLRKAIPGVVIIVMTGDENPETALQVIEAGALDYFRKPIDLREMRVIIDRALERRRIELENARLKREIESRYSFSQIIGNSDSMRDVFAKIRRVAAGTITVILRGESGTGKELVARAIHYNSARSSGPFIGVNCAAFPENLIEAELFGYEKGAFTGALATSEGLFERASGGTLFLDEIGSVGPPLQSKLLRVLQDREFSRLGGKKVLKADIRLITATNEDLEAAIQQGRFREDLYYRINVVPIDLPPLRERKEDIPLLIQAFLRRFSDEGQGQKQFDKEALYHLTEYAWKGNVRELENLVQRLVVMVDDDMIRASDLPPQFTRPAQEHQLSNGDSSIDVIGRLRTGAIKLDEELGRYEFALLRQALAQAEGTKTRAAEMLGVNKDRMKYLCRKYGL